MLCCIRFATPPPYYAIVYLCRKDLIKGEKEVSYLFYSALIKAYAPVHTTTTLQPQSLCQTKKSSNQLSVWSSPILTIIAFPLFWIINMNTVICILSTPIVINKLPSKFSLGKVFVCYQNWPIFRLLLLTELPLK